MERKTTPFETPLAKVKFELRAWITGKEAEYIEEPIYQAVQMGGQINVASKDVPITGFDSKVAIQETAHREVEVYVAKIVGPEGTDITDPKIVLEFVLNTIPDTDYNFIIAEIGKIKEANKKKLQV